ncbi:MAG TPA: hypothetical protein VL418_08795 [Devosiaceae bacterium]|nr:hypothetical protein [Devosiaceae bacterium]
MAALHLARHAVAALIALGREDLLERAKSEAVFAVPASIVGAELAGLDMQLIEENTERIISEIVEGSRWMSSLGGNYHA